jgi:hypothetical protein
MAFHCFLMLLCIGRLEYVKAVWGRYESDQGVGENIPGGMIKVINIKLMH